MSSSSSGHADNRVYDVDESDNSDEDDDYSKKGEDDVGDFIFDVAGSRDGDGNWNEFCGTCCTTAANNKDVTEHLEVDGEEKSSSASSPSFDGQQQTLILDGSKKRRVLRSPLQQQRVYPTSFHCRYGPALHR